MNADTQQPAAIESRTGRVVAFRIVPCEYCGGLQFSQYEDPCGECEDGKVGEYYFVDCGDDVDSCCCETVRGETFVAYMESLVSVGPDRIALRLKAQTGRDVVRAERQCDVCAGVRYFEDGATCEACDHRGLIETHQFTDCGHYVEFCDCAAVRRAA